MKQFKFFWIRLWYLTVHEKKCIRLYIPRNADLGEIFHYQNFLLYNLGDDWYYIIKR